MRYKKINEVKTIFNKISCNYDFLNSLLSLGLHKYWKNKLVDLLKPMDGENWADLCCGTGDLAFLIYKKVSPNGSITGVDSAIEILNVAKKRSQQIGDKFIKWEMQDVLEIDANNKNYDGICMSYGLRNLADPEEGLKKVFYLLSDRGRAGFLDFNHSKLNSLPDIFQKIYLRLVVVPISKIFQLGEEYSYIEQSIKNYPEKKELMRIAKEIGFKKIEYKNLFCKQMGILLLAK